MGRKQWRSLDELADSPALRELVAREFPGLEEDIVDPATRRDFLKILGASLGMAGLTSCRWPKELILPFASRPEGRVPGKPEQFATVMDLGGAGLGLLVTSYDGRPIKVEGNPLHPASLGGASALAQAAILGLYDPDRSQSPIRRDGGREIRVTMDEFSSFAGSHFGGLRAKRGEGLAVLSSDTSSPTVARLREDIGAAMPRARWFVHEPLARDNERGGLELAFGRAVRPLWSFDSADVVVCLDADPLHGHPNAVRHARDFARRRRGDDGSMSRIYVAEPVPTVTGAAADHRAAAGRTTVPMLAARLVAALAAAGLGVPAPGVGELPAELDRFAKAAARDLLAARGRGLVIAGWSQPAEVHALVALLNAALGNAGATVRYIEEPAPAGERIGELGAAISAGRIDTLLVVDGNPAYDAPADLDFGTLLAKVPTSIHLALYDDETSRQCRWHVPKAHFLESWGDARAWDGTVSVQQPLIEALYGGLTAGELLRALMGGEGATAHDLVRATIGRIASAAEPEAVWRRVLHDGLLAGSAPAPVTVAPRPAAADRVVGAIAAPPAAGLEAAFVADPSVVDGRFANNAWLQELPDPITKLTWDNAALIAPATAATLGVRDGDLLRVATGGRSLTIAACVVPGVAAGTVALPLGYGRTAAGRVGNGVGFDTYRLRTSDALHVATGATVERTGGRYVLATTQDHHAIDVVGLEERGRRIGELVVEGTFDEYRQHPGFVREEAPEPKSLALFAELSYRADHQWGMAIDLSACIGCNACTIACQAENNIPVVGKRQVANGREMHWIRIDRYFAGKPDNPKIALQPVACQHCETAPCESVCPVAATTHSEEGLNQMVYNRCVGTRYCSNNCPYKVRRFNFFNYFKSTPQTEKMAFNPEVTVRARGVMEKCTFCIQRIEAVKITAKNDRRPIRDGEVIPACAQTCPTEAIVFGDLRDPGSRVARLHAHQRSYAMLGELNVRPRNRYLARLRNPSPELGEA